VKIGKYVSIKYSNPQKAHRWRKTRLLSVERWRFIPWCDLQCRSAEENKKERKKERHPKQWQTGHSPRPPTSSDHNQSLHGWWPAVCQLVKCDPNRLRGYGAVRVENGPSPYFGYFGQWLIQQLVLPNKPWSHLTEASRIETSLECRSGAPLADVVGLWSVGVYRSPLVQKGRRRVRCCPTRQRVGALVVSVIHVRSWCSHRILCGAVSPVRWRPHDLFVAC